MVWKLQPPPGHRGSSLSSPPRDGASGRNRPPATADGSNPVEVAQDDAPLPVVASCHSSPYISRGPAPERPVSSLQSTVFFLCACLARLGNGCRSNHVPPPPRARRCSRARCLPPAGGGVRGGEGDAVNGGRGGRVARAAAGGQGEVLRRLGRQHHLLRRRLRRYSNHRRRCLTCI